VPLGIDAHGYSPTILEKIITAGGELKSYKLAAKLLFQLADFKISHMQVQRLTDEIGNELRDKRDHKTEQFGVKELKPKQDIPIDLACVSLDGGRIQTRKAGQGRGVHDECWKETKIGCLMRMTGKTFPEDPHPQLPRCFADKEQVKSICEAEMTEEISSREMQETPENKEYSPPRANQLSSKEWRPQRLFRTCIATLRDSNSFGRMLAAEAQHRGFYQAKRKAFLGDGQAYNWRIHKLWFSDFVPIIDFVHVVEYGHKAAKAIHKTESEIWDKYVNWSTVCWQGGIEKVMKELETWLARERDSQEMDVPVLDNDRCSIVQTVLTYFRNNCGRMKYPEYRCAGLPVTSSMIESLVKEFNYRVKGSEKFWNRKDETKTKTKVDHPVEAILQVRAALLSDDDRLKKHLSTRPGNPLLRYKTHVP